jgi:hypothetical protein
MNPVYFKKVDPNNRTTWIDWFTALEPKGGFRDAVERIQNGDARDHGRSVANGHAILLDETTYAIGAAA